MRVPGCGRSNADVFFCGEYPGVQEAREGEPFIGRTSRDFNRHYLPLLSLGREDVWLTNLYREYVPEGATYAKERKAADIEELRAELEAVAPRLIVPIGAAATRFFLDSDADLDEVHGILWRDPTHESRVIFPVTHVAAYTPELQSRVAYDFQQLRRVMYDEDVEPRVLWSDPYAGKEVYLDITDPKWFAAAFTGCTEVHIDTEGHPGREWSVQFAFQPGTAYMVRAANRECLFAFFTTLFRVQPRIVWHGSLHDYGIFRSLLHQLGLSVESLYRLEFDDTQIMAYLLQLEPIGLKPNAVRHCNMRMQDYTEVLGDAQLTLSQDYLITIFDKEQAAYAVRQQQEFEAINNTPLLDEATGLPKRTKAGVIRRRKTTVLPRLSRTALHKASERVLRSGRPYQLWQEQNEDIRVAAYNLELD